ncbi:MAG TPA: hypothetical protein VH302_11595, partial [Bryobacteraceae bacterium]|nr:hypothetical protein [Bryobacteraceae bacterium]
ERYVRYHAAQDRAYRRASQELMERRKQRQLAEIGIERQKQAAAEEQRRQAQEHRRQEDAQRRQNEEIRRDERHKIATEIAKTRKQLVEIKAAKALAGILPDDPAFASMMPGLRPNQGPSPVSMRGLGA